ISDMAALKNLLRQGLGLALVPRETVEEELREGTLQEVAGQESGVLPKQITCLLVRREPARPWPLRDWFLQMADRYYAGLRLQREAPAPGPEGPEGEAVDAFEWPAAGGGSGMEGD